MAAGEKLDKLVEIISCWVNGRWFKEDYWPKRSTNQRLAIESHKTVASYPKK